MKINNSCYLLSPHYVPRLGSLINLGHLVVNSKGLNHCEALSSLFRSLPWKLFLSLAISSIADVFFSPAPRWHEVLGFLWRLLQALLSSLKWLDLCQENVRYREFSLMSAPQSLSNHSIILIYLFVKGYRILRKAHKSGVFDELSRHNYICVTFVTTTQ